MGRDTRSRSRSAGRRGRRQRSQSGSRSRSRSRSHGRRNRRRREDEGRRRRRRRSRERRSDSEEERWQHSGMRSRSPPRSRWCSRDGSSQSDSGEEQSRGQWAHRRRRARSWSPSSSASSSASPRRSQSPRAAAAALSQQQNLQERLRLREERKQQEELMKAFETPEEKRARRLAKKEAKERKKREKMGWGEEYMGYTNTDNPFGDNNLLGTFIWNKALEKKGISHLEEKELKERNKRIQEDNRLELQKVKQLRLEREREKAMREQELEMLQREKEAEHFKTWEEQEDNFHLQQAKLRSKIRIRDGRAKPIDLLAKYISAEDDDLAVEMHEPYTFLNGLTVADMEDLLEDIQVYMELEQGKNADFWRDMTTITEDEISKLRKLEASGKGPGERREGVNASVSSDVQSVFKGKTYNQLQVIFQGIEGKIRAGGPNLDMGYWESLLQQLRAHMARARLRERHQDVLRQKLYKLKQEQGVESEPLFPILKQEPQSPSRSLEPEDAAPTPPGPSSEGGPVEAEVEGAAPTEGEGDGDGEGEGEGEAVLMEEDLIQQSLDDYDAGRYSPRLLTAHELPLDAHVLEPDEDLQRLQLSRQQLQVTGKGGAGGQGAGPVGRAGGGAGDAGGGRGWEGGQDAGGGRGPGERRPAHRRRQRERRGHLLPAGQGGHGPGRGAVQRGDAAHRQGLPVGRQVPATQAALLQPRAHGLRVEQVQPDTLRLRQPAAQDRAGLQVQHLLPRPHRQALHARVLPGGLPRQQGFRHPALPRRAAL
ncbi:splicing factor Cactin isoform X2 [Macaca mulatta]